MRVIIEVYVREVELETNFRGIPIVGGDVFTIEGSNEQVSEGITKFGAYLKQFDPKLEPSSLILSEN